MKDNYHHGNLREDLIKAGLKLINEAGIEALSLRKVASLCDVSHSAPYAHFKDKEELVEAIKDKVTQDFMTVLEESINSSNNASEALLNMGKRYISFFIDNPDYFKFLFANQQLTAHTSVDKEYDNDYPPFKLLKSQYLKYLSENNIKETDLEKELGIIKLWSTVHGLASIACMPNVKVSFNFEEKLKEDILLK